jgi:hypothetical protein
MFGRKCLKFASGGCLPVVMSAAFIWGLAARAVAEPGKCVLRVDGHTYLNGPCDINLEGGGSFQITPPTEVTPYYFAYVNLNTSPPRTATGAWNGEEADSHAGDDLGTLTRKGACWSNTHAIVCAYSK